MAFDFSFANNSASSLFGSGPPPAYNDDDRFVNVNELRFAGLWSPFRKYSRYEQVYNERNCAFLSRIDNNEASLSNSQAWQKIDSAPTVPSRFWKFYLALQQRQDQREQREQLRQEPRSPIQAPPRHIPTPRPLPRPPNRQTARQTAPRQAQSEEPFQQEHYPIRNNNVNSNR